MNEHGDVRAARILIVDDEQMNLELLEAFLEEDGYGNVTSTRDPRRVLELYDEICPDLILLDLHMPHLSGFEVMAQLGERVPADDLVPIVVLTADITQEARQRALAGGAKDFLNKPLDETEVMLRIRNLLQTRLLYLAQRRAREQAEAGERRAALLAEASRVLGTSLDTQTTLARLAHLAVPALADLCVLEVVGEDGTVEPLAFAPATERAEALLAHTRTLEHGVLGLAGPYAARHVSTEPLLLSELSAQEGEPGGDSNDGPAGGLPASLLWAPLVSGGQAIGALSLLVDEPGRALVAEDVAIAEELARRASFAMVNARLYRDAQEATRARDEILAVVAHDLRNPLNTIGLAVSLLLETVPEGPPHRHLAIVERSAKRMNRLIQDLLEVTRIETGKLRLELCDEPVHTLLEEAVSMLRPLAQARSIALEAELGDELPLARMDTARLIQVISNLVGNAIKFTPEGGRIRLGCELVDDELRFSVADSGAGIPPEQLPHVFGRFWQAADADRRGIGLGLSIARGIVEAHSGAIWVESRLGVGTTFYFTIRAAASGATIPTPEQDRASSPATETADAV